MKIKTQQSKSMGYGNSKAVLRGKFILIEAYLRKQEIPQMNNPILYLNNLEKKEQKYPVLVEVKKNYKIRAQINEIKTKNNLKDQRN